MADNLPEIRLRCPEATHKDLVNISANLGIPLSAFLRPKLMEIADSYPDRFKRDPNFYDQSSSSSSSGAGTPST